MPHTVCWRYSKLNFSRLLGVTVLVIAYFSYSYSYSYRQHCTCPRQSRHCPSVDELVCRKVANWQAPAATQHAVNVDDVTQTTSTATTASLQGPSKLQGPSAAASSATTPSRTSHEPRHPPCCRDITSSDRSTRQPAACSQTHPIFSLTSHYRSPRAGLTSHK